MSKKTTKRALAMSFVSVFLCVCMLVGTTFAWFTDSVTSSNNVIKSGTLDVEMSWADGKTDPANTTWTDASKGAIFKNDLWEPGYTEVRHIKIENKGTLALKYQLNIIPNGVPNGVVSELANVIDVYFIDPAQQVADRTALTDTYKIGTLAQVLAGMPASTSANLPADKNDTVTIALKMQESATNEYQGLSIGSDFSVVLMATQKDYESDSFDNTYDATVEIPEMDIKVIDGNTYYYKDDGNVVLRSVPYGNVGTTFTVPDFVTIIGVSKDKNDTNGPVFSKSSPVESITLPEGVKEINARAINMQTLKSINFPSTLTYIGEQAFRQTGMSELTIPANVKVIDEGAFRDMANLTTVTVKGNVAFDNNAFRSCPNLTSIYLLGDDVTFAGGQFATHADSGDATDITIYVKNTTVAARVYAAQSSAYGYEVKILGTAADGSDATEVAQVKNSAALDAAITGGAKNIVLAAGTYDFPSIPAGTTIVGQDGVVFEDTLSGTLDNVTIKNVDIKADNAQRWAYSKGTLVFEDCTFEATDVYAIHYDGLNGANITYKNCTIIGWAAIGSGAEHVTFDGCKIYGNGSYGVIRLYSPGTITNCTFDVANVNTTDVYQDGIHAVDCEIKVSNNTNVNGAMSDLYNRSGTGVITEQ